VNSDIRTTEPTHDGAASRADIAAVPRIPRQRTSAGQARGQDGVAAAPQLEAFEGYVERRHASLLRTAYLLTGDRHTAEDLVQTALARAWSAWTRIREPAAVDAYVHRTLIHAQRSVWRRRRVHEVLTGGVPEPGHSQQGAATDLHEVLWSALAELPRQQRATLVLRYYEDLPNCEIARVLGVSEGTVKSSASRGLAKLRQKAAAAGSSQTDTARSPFWTRPSG
jgi:RNA polymerase sigma-70 factor (sigma-E family)